MTGKYSSRLPGFRAGPPAVRLAKIGEVSGAGDLAALSGAPGLPVEVADGMVENVVGTFELPIGVATNFQVNGRDYLIPMVVEEPSVIAAASYMARIVRDHGGFEASSTAPVMRGQIQVLGVADLEAARSAVLAARDDILATANAQDQTLVALGGGCQDLDIHLFEETAIGAMLVVHLLVDVRDAMGANSVNTMAEAVAPMVARITGGEVRLRILSNLADRRLASARVSVPVEALAMDGFGGARVAQGIVEACAFAEVDPYRAATHNKGIMNGIDPVVVATGNDWRAIEAGAHAYAARSGRYTSLTRWRVLDGHLLGEIELPIALGLVGGATKTHPGAQAALRILQVGSATELAQVVAAVGLAQNMAALRALATEGIQRGHMALHARNLAIAAGATGADVDRIAQEMAASGQVTADKARALLR